MTVAIAQYRTACAGGCGAPIEQGQPIVATVDGWAHTACPDAAAAPLDHGPLCRRCFTYHRGECAW